MKATVTENRNKSIFILILFRIHFITILLLLSLRALSAGQECSLCIAPAGSAGNTQVKKKLQTNVESMEGTAARDSESAAFRFETEAEQPLELEKWMTDGSKFENDYYLPEPEEALVLEEWMVSDDFGRPLEKAPQASVNIDP